MAQSARYWRDRRVPLAQAAGRIHPDAARHRRPLGHSRGRQALLKVVVDGANSPKAALLRDTFAIPNKPKNLKETREDWARDVPVWTKQAVNLGIKLD
jgi:hypothetical protein